MNYKDSPFEFEFELTVHIRMDPTLVLRYEITKRNLSSFY